MPILLIFLS